MGKYNNLKKHNEMVVQSSHKAADAFREVAEDKERRLDVYKNVNVIIGDIDSKFKNATKLDGVDLSFLFLATAIQCVRQYFITNFKPKDARPDDKEAAKKTKGKNEEHSNRKHRLYNPSFDEIFNNPVPFDTNFGSSKYKLGIGGGFGHRAKTLGHDPILGWIFGTSNIATSTLTTWQFDSYHIKTGYTKIGAARDLIKEHARTDLVLEKTTNKLLKEDIEGKKKVALSLFKEAVHLKSDVGSKASLPIPLVSAFSPELASQLADYGLDMANVLNVGKQAAYAAFVNSIIAMIHSLFYDEPVDGKLSLYEVRTRKILSYSNVIASASNVIAVGVTEAVSAFSGNAELARKGASYLDIGGILVTCYRLLEDYKFIQMVKEEFLENEWTSIVVGEEYKFMKEVKKNEY